MSRPPTPRRSHERRVITPAETYVPECPLPRPLPAECLIPATPPKEWLCTKVEVDVQEVNEVEGRSCSRKGVAEMGGWGEVGRRVGDRY